MAKPFNLVRQHLERQCVDVRFDPASGLSREALVAEFSKHRAESPDEPRLLTKAWLLHLVCSQGRIAPEPDDYFVGKVEHHGLLHGLRDEWWGVEIEREFECDEPPIPGAFAARLDCSSHICPDWRALRDYGAAGLRDRAAARPGAFYQAVAMVFDGLVTLIRRFNTLQPNPVLAALSDRPPRTFHESLQLAYLYHEVMEFDGMAVRSMGRFDMLYNELYVRDLQCGRLTRGGAKELLKYFWIKFYAQTQGKRFGKPFLFGPEANELSVLSFEVFRELQVVDPKFHVRMGAATPKAFVDTVVGCIQAGCTSVVIANNDRQIDMLCKHGKAREDAKDYILIGCYEPAVMGKELNCSGAADLNLAKAVETVVKAGDHDGFDAMMGACLATLDAWFSAIADRVRRQERLWPRINPAPLLSGTMDSCLEKGRDVSEAGAAYNTSGCCCVGLADAVDSLATMRELVYEKRRFTQAALRAALAANWMGYDALRLMVRNRASKWGNNDPGVDGIAVAMTDFLGRRINREPNSRGGVFQAALYGILPAATALGKLTGALPNGRRAGEPLSMNTGAVPGMDRNGVTSVINSVTKIGLAQFPNGTVLDVMLHPSAVQGREGIETIGAIIRSHLAQGGMAIQFNIFDAEVLRDAKRNPENYANLQVRVCGWNVRFADLAPTEQDLFIAKAEVGR